MRRRIIPTRMLALLLTISLFLGNDQTVYSLAVNTNNETSETGGADNGGTVLDETGDIDNSRQECEHEWVTDPETSKTTCSKCGIEKPDDPDAGEECEHEWVTDPETSKTTCSKCGIEKPDDPDAGEECEHEWVTDPETSKTTCSKCGIEKPDDPDAGEECEHEWVTDPETSKTTCSKCGIEKTEDPDADEACEHEWIRDPETLEVVCSVCGEADADYVEDDICPESDWGFHIYDVNEDGTGYVCVLCGAEKETLDPLDVTAEMFMNSKYGIAVFAVGDNYDTRAASDLPATLSDLQASGRKDLMVDCLGDLLVLQDLSQEFDFNGYTITILQRNTGVVPNYTSDYNWDLTGTAFDGLGCEQFPFSGTVTAFYSNAATFKINKPFFQYLSTNATINDMHITGVDRTASGPMGLVAGTLVRRSQSDDEFVKLNGVELNGSVSSTKAAGMVFGRVVAENGTSLTLPYNSKDIVLCPTTQGTVRGLHAGGFAGETEGDVTLDIADAGVTGNLVVQAGSSSNWGYTNLESGRLGSDELYDITPAGGMYVGAMKEGTLRIAGNTYTVNVQKYSSYGGPCGGFVGMAIGTEVTTDTLANNPITVSGTGVVGGIAGGILGYYEHPAEVEDKILTLDYITVSTTVNASNSYDYYAGGAVGRYYRNIVGATTKVYDTIDHFTESGAVRSYRYAGGVVGFVHGSNLRIGGEEAESIKVTGSVYANTSSVTVGGVAALIVGQYVEIQNAKVSATLYTSSYYTFVTGGIVGSLGRDNETDRKSVIKISDVNVTATFGRSGWSCSNYRGGVLGRVWQGNMAALDGTVTIGMSVTGGGSYLQYFGRSGYVAGYQREALIYFEDTATYTHNSVQNVLDDIGTYGGVYRNGTWGESAKLFSYEQGKVLGTVGGSWTIDSEADFIRLAVMLNTEGRFASDCFNYPAADNKAALPDAKNALLAASYTVTRSLDLKSSGIYGLNRNDYKGFNDQPFTGTFAGSGSDNITIDLGDTTTRQTYVALFPLAGDGATFRGLRLRRTINGPTLYGAGLACRAAGNFTAEDIYIDLISEATPSLNGISGFDSGSDSDWRTETNGSYVTLPGSRQYYAGLVSQVVAGNGTTFKADSVKINGTLSATRDNSSYQGNVQIGGMVADYTGTNTTISVNNYELMERFKITTTSAYRISGMITDINYNDSSTATSDKTILSMTGITVHDGATITQGGTTGHSCGGWLGNVWKNVIPDSTLHYSIKDISIGDGSTAAQGPQYSVYYSYGGLVNTVTGRIQLKDTKINNGMFRNTQSSGVDGNGLLFRVGNDAIIEIDGYEIDGREIDGSPAGSSGGSVNVQFRNLGTNYDEIVAYNIGPSAGNINDYKTGGIVNIIYDGFPTNHYVYQNRLVTPHNARRTRYYYNLFGDSFEDEDNYLEGSLLTSGGTTVTNEKQMMIWHLTQYMNDSIRRFLSVYYEGGAISGRSQDTTFLGNIDLKTVSYYPSPVSGGVYTYDQKAVVTFYGQDITDKATSTMTPSSDQKVHYMLHGGLFLSKQGNVTVQGKDADNFLTLKGSIANLSDDNDGQNQVNKAKKNHSGAVFARDIKDEKNIYRVCFDGLYVANYTDEDPTGLMLGIVKDETTLDLSWIETKGYESFRGKKAASALIGVVGDYEASKISIEIKNIKLESRSNNNGIFRYASLIDENYYKEDTENPSPNIRRIRYLFTKAAFLGTNESPYFPFNGTKEVYGNNEYGSVGSYVTIGFELGEGIEYWDVEYGPTTGSTYTLPFQGRFTWTQDSIENTYLPYVHKMEKHKSSKDIEVNPKNKSIAEGCGTYEDPYIINSPKQLMALARYLQNKNDYKYLGGWQIHQFESGRLIHGDDICHKDHPGDESDQYLKTYPTEAVNGNVVLPEGFPTQDELCQAYYMIKGDVDLSTMSNPTDRQIAEDFVGLGTSKIPFRGVIIGELGSVSGKGSNERPTLTLPLKSYWTDDSKDVNYGLIQYAIGAVVKDLVIHRPEENDITKKLQRTGTAKVEKMAGGVMADVIGGDNIIDNVSVTADVVLMSKNCTAGAYAGTVEQGSLILRNIPEDCAQGFRIGSWGGDDAFHPYSADVLAGYEYVSGLIGKVEDGCVIYEDNMNGTGGYDKPVLDHDLMSISGIYRHDLLPISKHYDIIVKSQMDVDTNGEKIAVTSSLTDGKTNYTAKVNTSAQLQIVSMVINSDAFSIYGKEGGYKAEAACRKAKYSDVGAVDISDLAGEIDYKAATTEDDKIYYYPYLYQYFDFSGVNTTESDRLGTEDWKATLKKVSYKVPDKENANRQIDSEGYVSTLNVAIYGITEIMNYELDAGQTYNLAQYCRGFRGIGATYGMLETKPQMSGSVNYGDYDEVKAGAFYSDFRANFNGNGATIDLGMDKIYDQTIHTTALFNDLLDRDASKDNYFTIENIVVRGFSRSIIRKYDANGTDITEGNGNYPNRTAAIVGLMRRPWKLSNIKLTEMEVVGKGHAAGIVAWIEPGGSSDGGKIVDYRIVDCTLDENTKVSSYGGSAGGIVAVVTQNVPTSSGAFKVYLDGCQIGGTNDKQVDIAVINRTTDMSESVSGDYGTRRGVGRSGGFIGYVGRKNVISNTLSVDIVIGNSADTGMGQEAEVVWANITGAYSTGGLIGTYDAGQSASTSSTTAGRSVQILSAKVEDCEIDGTRGNQGVRHNNDANNNDDTYYTYGVGGLIGEMRAGSLTIQPGDDQDITLDRTNVTSSQNPASGTAYGMYAGGVVGCLKVYKAIFADITMDGHKGTDSNLELGGQKYTVKSARSDAGGIIGYAAYGSDTLTMHGIRVTGMNITVDNRTEQQIENRQFATTTKNTSTSTSSSSAFFDNGNAGGLIGTNKMQLTLVGDGTEGSGAQVDYCMITGSVYNVGGLVGTVERYSYSSSSVRAQDIEDVVIDHNIIGYNNIYPFINNTTASAGGVYGKIDTNYSTNWGATQRVENARISNNWIYGPYTGGVLGYGSSYQYLYSNSKDDASIIVEKNDLYGRYVGGAIGYCGASRINYIGTKISDNRMQAYGTGTNSAYVGGFSGYVSNTYNNNNSYAYRLDLITVEKNHILAGNTTTDNKSIYAGGLFGYVNAFQNYVYQPKLTDNLIGYSESTSGAALRTGSSGAGTATLQAMFNSTDGEMNVGRTVSLLNGTSTNNLKAIDMPTADEIRTNGVGYYAARIGNFVGNYSTSYAHTYILAPKLTYHDDFTGTRPVIDVGMASSGGSDGENPALLDSPYAYRSYIYIIYHDPEGTANGDAQTWNEVEVDPTGTGNNYTTGGDNWKYLFEGISYDELINAYKTAQTTGDLSKYLEAYRLNVAVNESQTHETLYSNLYKNSNGALLTNLKAGPGKNKNLPVLVLDTQYGTPDELMKGVVAALTNVGGVYCDDNTVYSDGTGMGYIADIQTEAWIVDHVTGKVSKNPDKTVKPSLKAIKDPNSSSSIKWRVEYQSSGSYDDDGYDFEKGETIVRDQTFTMFTITYSWNYSCAQKSGNVPLTRAVKIRIPVFAVERLNIDTHLKVIEGLEYNAEKVKKEGFYDSVLVVNDSSYTFYTEYIYGDARKKFPGTEIGKHIGTYTETDDGQGTYEKFQKFPVDTKLTLIALDDNHKVYYYTVTGDETGPIPYEAFKNENGENYQYKDISENDGFMLVGEDETFITRDYEREPAKVEKDFEYSNVAVERFLITVDISDVDPTNLPGDDRGEIRIVDYRVDITDGIRAKTTLTEHTILQLTIQKGTTIKFRNKIQSSLEDLGDAEKTYIDGFISANEESGFVDIWATIEISAPMPFWTAVQQNGDATIDSANHDKYLELQIYMTEYTNPEEIMLPSGTYGYIEGERTAPVNLEAKWFWSGDPSTVPEGWFDDPDNVPADHIDRISLDPYYDTSNIYFYKDGRVLYKLNDLSKIIQAELNRESNIWGLPGGGIGANGAIYWVDYMRLDFRNAEMTPFVDDRYDMYINLLRIGDANYPVGGEVLDTYSNTLAAARGEDLACALETKDLLQLGINTYDNQTEMPHSIDVDFKMDFNGVMTGNDATDRSLEDKHYTVAYRIWQKKFAKDGQQYVYVPYEGDQLKLELVNDPDGKVLTRETAKSADGTKDLEFWYVDYMFGWDEIKKGTETEGSKEEQDGDTTETANGKGVIVRNLQLTVDNASKMDLSNYKVQAILYVNDFGYPSDPPDEFVIDLDVDTMLTDFFVFTVAKLKTDLDY